MYSEGTIYEVSVINAPCPKRLALGFLRFPGPDPDYFELFWWDVIAADRRRRTPINPLNMPSLYPPSEYFGSHDGGDPR